MCSSSRFHFTTVSDQPTDTWYCSNCEALNMSYYDRCPVCEIGRRCAYATQQDGAGYPAPGVWTCPRCGDPIAEFVDCCGSCGWPQGDDGGY
ncbi:unnamed protein product [Periconia digitata]|uniref:RanBP2-type domain-containing protein n=1 Tax=Periconia digitata TaxID=1303443 RepID=A0A9W4UTA6_9PLEO|nr:unnamed protein product [Periconia digitata]